MNFPNIIFNEQLEFVTSIQVPKELICACQECNTQERTHIVFVLDKTEQKHVLKWFRTDEKGIHFNFNIEENRNVLTEVKEYVLDLVAAYATEKKELKKLMEYIEYV